MRHVRSDLCPMLANVWVLSSLVTMRPSHAGDDVAESVLVITHLSVINAR
jgi:hypothetical protein